MANRYFGNYGSFLMFILMIIYFCNALFAQEIVQQDSSSYYHFFYNHKPDSVFVNGSLVPYEMGKKFPADPGDYHFRAVLNCYKPLEKTIHLKSRQIKVVRLKFKHLNTAKKNIHRWLTRGNYLVGTAGIMASSASSNGRKYALPLNILMLVENYMWHRRVGRQFDPCSNVYQGEELKRSPFRLFFGLSSNVKDELSIESAESLLKIFTFPDASYHVAWDTQLKVTVNSNSKYASNYALNWGIEKDLFRGFYGSLSAHFFPFATTEIQFQDSLTYYRDANKHSFKENTSFLLFNYDLNFALFHVLDHKLSISAGGYMSNSIKGRKEIFLTMPEVNRIADSTATHMINYNYQAKGFKVGLHYNYYFRDKFSLYFDYNLYFRDEFVVNGLINESSFYMLNTGVSIGI